MGPRDPRGQGIVEEMSQKTTAETLAGMHYVEVAHRKQALEPHSDKLGKLGGQKR